MRSKPFTNRQLIRRIFTYALMAVSISVIVTITTLFMMGYRLDNGNLEQYSLIQFSSTPSGATVSVDGAIVGSKTPTKQSVTQGEHQITIWRDGYEKWTKKINIKIGTVKWLNYALLVPNKLTVESLVKFDSMHASLASPKGDVIIVAKYNDRPVFELVDITADKIKTKTITLSNDAYTPSDNGSSNHEFNLVKWDGGGRYVLVEHKYNQTSEWLVVDTQDVKTSKNITKTFNIAISDIVFDGTSGNKFYVQDSGDIRKLDLSSGTVSKPLVGKVMKFEYYGDTKVITYVGRGKDDTNERVVGVMREGDESAAVIRTTKNDLPVMISTTRYFNENYVAIAEGQKIDIYSGSYPNTTSDNNNSLKLFTSFNTDAVVDSLGFSPNGEYLMVKSAGKYISYDLEYQEKSVISASNSTLRWLNGNYLWSDQDGTLSIREFDGANYHAINKLSIGQAVTLTNNGRYLYSIGNLNGSYQLQRVRMILP